MLIIAQYGTFDKKYKNRHKRLVYVCDGCRTWIRTRNERVRVVSVTVTPFGNVKSQGAVRFAYNTHYF